MADLIVSCSDGRVAQPLAELQRRLENEDADRMLVPGGPLVLTRTGAERRVAYECVDTVVETHHPRRIVLVSHQDCAAYERALGGLGFDQQAILERDLRRVKASLEQRHRGIEILCYVIPWREGVDGACFGEAELVE